MFPAQQSAVTLKVNDRDPSFDFTSVQQQQAATSATSPEFQNRKNLLKMSDFDSDNDGSSTSDLEMESVADSDDEAEAARLDLLRQRLVSNDVVSSLANLGVISLKLKPIEELSTFSSLSRSLAQCFAILGFWISGIVDKCPAFGARFPCPFSFPSWMSSTSFSKGRVVA